MIFCLWIKMSMKVFKVLCIYKLSSFISWHIYPCFMDLKQFATGNTLWYTGIFRPVPNNTECVQLFIWFVKCTFTKWNYSDHNQSLCIQYSVNSGPTTYIAMHIVPKKHFFTIFWHICITIYTKSGRNTVVQNLF